MCLLPLWDQYLGSMLNLRNSAGKENIARGNGPRARRIGIGWKSCDIYDRNTVSESIQLRPEGSYLRNPTFVSASELFLLYKPDYYSLFVAANDVETGAPEFPQKGEFAPGCFRGRVSALAIDVSRDFRILTPYPSSETSKTSVSNNR